MAESGITLRLKSGAPFSLARISPSWAVGGMTKTPDRYARVGGLWLRLVWRPTPPEWMVGSGLAAYASTKLRVTAGSTWMPGPVVVETTIFFK
jgi:hypothetical protein